MLNYRKKCSSQLDSTKLIELQGQGPWLVTAQQFGIQHKWHHLSLMNINELAQEKVPLTEEICDGGIISAKLMHPDGTPFKVQRLAGHKVSSTGKKFSKYYSRYSNFYANEVPRFLRNPQHSDIIDNMTKKSTNTQSDLNGKSLYILLTVVIKYAN